ncbi:hypothetical protein [Streptomyces luteireticuli]|uniref:DUF397 domain-containing protein n=1 Tax=Streptomyces luteireticuli TaxID=173858 RepID=A0ABP3J2R6_9ACTN
MHARTRAALPAEATALELADLLWDGVIDRAEHHPDGSWSVTTGPGRTLTLRPEDAARFIDRATTGTGPNTLVTAPATGTTSRR